MLDWFILFTAVFVASLLQASTGFGFSILGTPFLFMIYSAHTAIQINIILSLFISIFMIFKIKKEMDRLLLFRLIKGSLPGMVLGLCVYLFVPILWLKILVGILILLLTGLLILKLTMQQTTTRDFLTGGISGLLTTSIGVPGPPLLLYFSGAGTKKEVLRSTTLTYYLFTYFISLVLQLLFDGTNQTVWLASLSAAPSVFLGILCGQYLFKRISQKAFTQFSYAILIFTGCYLLITSLS